MLKQIEEACQELGQRVLCDRSPTCRIEFAALPDMTQIPNPKALEWAQQALQYAQGLKSFQLVVLQCERPQRSSSETAGNIKFW
jgi:hypothetical protein